MPPVQRFQRNKSWHSLYVGIIVLLAINPTATALYVVPGSNCTPACSSALTAYTTNGTNIACHDGDYNGTLVGEAFQDCVSCELSSQTLDSWTAQTDLGWALCMSTYAVFELHTHKLKLISRHSQHEICFRLVSVWIPRCNKQVGVQPMYLDLLQDLESSSNQYSYASCLNDL